MVHSLGPIKASGRHAHESLTLGVVISGRRTICVNNTTYEAEPGCVLCIAPHKVHACRDMGNCEYIMFNIPTSLIGTLGFTETLSISDIPTIDSPRLFGMIIRLFDAVSESAFAMEFQSQLIMILSMVLKEVSSTKHASADIPRNITQAAQFMESNHYVTIRLEELAQIAELSPCRFNRRFAQAFGMPPHEYHNQIRTREAKRLIATGTPLAETAAQCGFNDQSHMNRIFKKLMGMTPGQYAKAFR